MKDTIIKEITESLSFPKFDFKSSEFQSVSEFDFEFSMVLSCSTIKHQLGVNNRGARFPIYARRETGGLATKFEISSVKSRTTQRTGTNGKKVLDAVFKLVTK